MAVIPTSQSESQSDEEQNRPHILYSFIPTATIGAGNVLHKLLSRACNHPSNVYVQTQVIHRKKIVETKSSERANLNRIPCSPPVHPILYYIQEKDISQSFVNGLWFRTRAGMQSPALSLESLKCFVMILESYSNRCDDESIVVGFVKCVVFV